MEAIKTTHVSITEETQEILKTILLLEESYAANYLINILRGKKQFLKQLCHAEYETFDSLADRSGDYLRNVIHFLVQQHYLQVQDSVYGRLSTTEKGITFLDAPKELRVRKRDLRRSTYDYLLLTELRKVRRNLSQEQSIASFRIFTDYSLDSIIREKPTDVNSLRLVPGFGEYKANRYGPAILKVVQEVLERKKQDDQIRLLKKVRRPSYQQVKSLFEVGLSEAAIARKRMIKPQSVRTTLLDLHRAGEIDLRHWIETTVEKEVLQKGSNFFLKAENIRLKDAYEALGLDYDTLRLCRLYVSKLSFSQEELKAAS
ncbi:MAG: RQC domain-containing protein [Bacteroidota bacterium]